MDWGDTKADTAHEAMESVFEKREDTEHFATLTDKGIGYGLHTGFDV